MDTTTINDLVHEALRLFKQAYDLREEDDTTPENWPSATLSSEAERFQLWAVNLSLFVSGHESSNSYRVREAQCLGYLRELVASLTELIQIGNGEKPRFDNENRETGDNASDSDSSNPWSEDDESDMELLLDSIKNMLDVLYMVSAKRRNTSSRGRLSRAVRYRGIDPGSGVDFLQAIAPFDYDYVRSLFLEYQKLWVSQEPKKAPPPGGSDETNDDAVWEPIRTVLAQDQAAAASFLVRRISRANTSRRQQFTYWKNPREKFDSHTRASIHAQFSLLPTEGNDALRSQMVNTPSSNSLHDTHEDFAPTVTTATVLDAARLEVASSKSVVSVSECEPSMRQPARDAVDFPPPPKARPGANFFECPYCFVICSNATLADKAWKAHLIHDLRPYICTYEDCRTPNQLFETRRDWDHHENTCHRPLWRCLEHVDLAFTQLEAYKTHLRADHGTEDMFRIIFDSKSVRTVTDRPCPICSVVLGNLRESENHIALHLERFALFALPRSTGLESDDVSDSKSNVAQGTIAGSRDDAFDSDLDINSHWPDENPGTNPSAEEQPNTKEEHVIEDTGDTSSEVPDINTESPAADSDANLVIDKPVNSPNINKPTAVDNRGEVDGATIQVIDAGHDGLPTPVHTVLFSPDAKLLALASNELVRIWDVGAQKLLPPLEGFDHKITITSFAWSHDASKLASGSWDHRVLLWDVSTGTCLHTLVGHDGPVRALAFSPDDKSLVSGSHDKTCKVWDVESGTERLSLAPIMREVTAVGISPDNRFLVSGSNDGCPRIYDLATGKPLHFIRSPSLPVLNIAFHTSTSQLTILATGSINRNISLWDLESGQLVRTIVGHKDAISLLAFPPDQSYMVSGSVDGIVRTWDTGDWRETGIFTTDQSSVHAVGFSADGCQLACSTPGEITIRELVHKTSS